jgi:FkbM family methyltransferase
MPVSCDPIDRQYFPTDVTLHAGYSRLINCGSYDGDTIRNLRQKVGQIDALACFEPDAGNFKKLSAYLYANKADIAQEIVAFPCGVWSENAQLRFASSNETNSTISQSAAGVLQCVAIDDVLVNFRPTCINMDIEGAEPQALAGARQTLAEYRPDLAISVYHEPRHLWEIANYLDTWVAGYEFYLRNYTGFPAETVLYATQRR